MKSHICYLVLPFFCLKMEAKVAPPKPSRLEDIASVSYANHSDPTVKNNFIERSKLDQESHRIIRQLSALDPIRCIPQFACSLSASPPNKKSGVLNDYTYLLQTMFEGSDEDDDNDSGGSSKNSGNKGVIGDIANLLGSKKKKNSDEAFDDEPNDGDEGDDDYSSEEEDLLGLSKYSDFPPHQIATKLHDEEKLSDSYMTSNGFYDAAKVHAVELAQDGPRRKGDQSDEYESKKFGRFRTELDNIDMDRSRGGFYGHGHGYDNHHGHGQYSGGRRGWDFSSLMPRMPQISLAFSSKKNSQSSTFGDDPFFDGFRRRRRRSLDSRTKNASLRKMKNEIDSMKNSAEIFRAAAKMGEKVKSARQCRGIFDSCPLNKKQVKQVMTSMKKAVSNYSNRDIVPTTTTKPKDVVATLSPPTAQPQMIYPNYNYPIYPKVNYVHVPSYGLNGLSTYPQLTQYPIVNPLTASLTSSLFQPQPQQSLFSQQTMSSLPSMQSMLQATNYLSSSSLGGSGDVSDLIDLFDDDKDENFLSAKNSMESAENKSQYGHGTDVLEAAYQALEHINKPKAKPPKHEPKGNKKSYSVTTTTIRTTTPEPQRKIIKPGLRLPHRENEQSEEDDESSGSSEEFNSHNNNYNNGQVPQVNQDQNQSGSFEEDYSEEQR